MDDEKVDEFEQTYHVLLKEGKRGELTFLDNSKHEMDIVLYKMNENKIEWKCAIELKFPLNKNQAIPHTMYQFVKDISFIEELKKNGFDQAFCLVLVENGPYSRKLENSRQMNCDIYSYFQRGEKSSMITGVISQPTGKWDTLHRPFVFIKGEYSVHWNPVTLPKTEYDSNHEIYETTIEEFQYYIIEAKNS